MNVLMIMNIEQQDKDHDQHQHQHQQAWDQVSALDCQKTLNMSIINVCWLKRWFCEVVYQFLIPGHYLTSWTSRIATQIYRFIEMGSQLKGFSRCAVRSFITSFWGTPGLWGDWRVGFWSRVGVIQGPPPQYFGFMTWGGGNVSMTKGAKLVG